MSIRYFSHEEIMKNEISLNPNVKEIKKQYDALKTKLTEAENKARTEWLINYLKYPLDCEPENGTTLKLFGTDIVIFVTLDNELRVMGNNRSDFTFPEGTFTLFENGTIELAIGDRKEYINIIGWKEKIQESCLCSFR